MNPNELPAHEQVPPVNPLFFKLSVSTFIEPKIAHLLAEQREQDQNAAANPDQPVNQNPTERIAELRKIQVGALRGGSDAMAFLDMVQRELVVKEPELTARIDSARLLRERPLGAFPDDHIYQHYADSIHLGEAALRLSATRLPKGAVEDWITSAVHEKLDKAVLGRNETIRGRMQREAFCEAFFAKFELDFLRELMHDAEKMSNWHAS